MELNEIRTLTRELETAYQELGRLRAENIDLKADLKAAQALARGIKRGQANYYQAMVNGARLTPIEAVTV